MRWPDLLRTVLALVIMLLAGRAVAITPVTDSERSATRQTIATQLGPGHSYALIIGISEFDDPAWHGLSGVPDEIARIRTVLAAQAFTIVPESTVGRLDHTALTAAITRFFTTYGSKAENRLIVYVATHGFADPTRPEGDGYLIASDSSGPSDGRIANGYSVKELSAALTSVTAQHVFLFFNSCFSGAMLPEPTRAADPLLAGKPVQALSKETAAWTLDLLAHNARLVLTAGDASETVPDRKSPFADAVVAALSGDADADGDGLTLGSEIAQFVRARVARASRAMGHPNDPVFAVLPKFVAPPSPRPDLAEPAKIDYALQGDFVFLTPGGPRTSGADGKTAQQALLEEKRARLDAGQFLACVDCPTMVRQPDGKLALASTEITFAQWDACYREMGCHRYLSDDGFGRGDRPAGNMTWLDALEYLAWLGGKAGTDAPCMTYRFPTTGEWLAAALYTPAGPVTWDVAVADAQPVCWGCGPGEDGLAAQRTAAVPANAAGLYDMIGNLWEWVDDDRLCDFTALRQNGSCGVGRVLGGSFATTADALPRIGEGGPAPRTGNTSPWSSPTIGLRPACDIRR